MQIITETKNIMQSTDSVKDTNMIINQTLQKIHDTHLLTTHQYKLSIHTLNNYNKFMKNNYQDDSQNTSNYFCFITGETTNTHLINLVELGFSASLYVLFILYFFAQFVSSGDTIFLFINQLKNIHYNYQQIRPPFLPGMGTISFGTRHRSPSPPNQLKTFPTTGWIKAIGTNGQSFTNGSFIGGIRSLKSPIYDYYTYFVGITGFIGISIILNNQINWFLGGALQMKTEYYPPIPYQVK
jgi:hypothetical protein